MSAVDHLFRDLRSRGQKAFVPFVTAGDPDLEFTAALGGELIRRGAHLLEIGVPYSDPIADGPVIQASYTRALARATRLDQILTMTRGLAKSVTAPLVAMVSYAIIHRRGPEAFVESAAAAGLAGLIVPDLPVEESSALAKICGARDLSLLQLVTPTTPRERAIRIAEASTGFLYYVSVAGITGERTSLPATLAENVAWLRGRTSLPILIGFGVNSPDHVRALAGVADGLIVGSAIVRRIAEASEAPREVALKRIGDYASEMLAAYPA